MARDSVAGYGIFVTTKTELEVIEWDQGWDYMQKGFTKLKRILEGLSESQFTSEENMMLYTTIYNMCTQKPPYDYSWQLYDKYREVLDDYIASAVLPSLRNKHDEFLLLEFVKRWETHKVMVKWLSFFFNYLDRFFVCRRSLPKLREVGLARFRDLVYQAVKADVKVSVIAIINKEREGEKIDIALLKNVVNIFIEMGMGQTDAYVTDFEAHMLADTAEYYSQKASNWILEDSCPEYIFKAEESLRRERDRVSRYLHSSSEQKLIEKVQFELLVVHSGPLLEKDLSGFCALLRDDQVEDLSRLYRLYSKIPHGLDPVAKLFREHVTAEGINLVQQTENAANDHLSNVSGRQEQLLVKDIAELHDKYMAYVSDCFMNHSSLRLAIKEAFEAICNRTVAESSFTELLVALCDNILKTGGRGKLSDETIEETLEKVVKLLPYISDKNLFVEFYRKKLARRLIFSQSLNEDVEKSTLAKLKQQCGGQFTSKMEGMVTDLTLARENRTRFDEYLHSNPNVNPGMDLAVTVLTTGFWPSYKSFDLHLPVELVKCVEVFKAFYETKTKNRKLTWIYSLGTCNIVGKFDMKVIELVVSTYQAALLMLFNTADRWSYSEISTQLNLNNDDLVRILHSLSCAKYKILVKEPNTNTISPDDTFEFNAKFTHKMRRIKIPLPPVDETKEVIEDVDKDKRYAIDVAVVRIMKSRKALCHRELVVECVEQLGHMFKPDIRAIKKRIEDLITRDYLERDKDDLKMIRYLS